MNGHMVAFVVVLLLVVWAMRRKRRVAPEPEVVYVPPTPPVSALDTETYELVEAGIPEELIDQYVAAKERSWWDRNKYKAAGTVFVGAGGAAYLHWRNETEKRRLRKMYGALRRNEQETLRREYQRRTNQVL